MRAPRNAIEAAQWDVPFEPLRACQPLPEAAPGSARKILELERRYMQGETLHHELDGSDIDWDKDFCCPPRTMDPSRLVVDKKKGSR